MGRLRKSHEEGHRRKFLVVIDETPECETALSYAAIRAEHTGGGLVLLYVVEPGGFQHWLGVENIMRAEAIDEARMKLNDFAEAARAKALVDPELTVREGNVTEEIISLISDDEDIAILVLGSAESSDGPGPLVSAIAGSGASSLGVPVTIVPGDLTDEEIRAIA